MKKLLLAGAMALALAGPAGAQTQVVGLALAPQIAQTVTASSAYTSGNAIGGLMTIANATRSVATAGTPGTTGMLQAVVEDVKSAQSAQTDIFVFNANPTGSTCTDKTAFVLAAADAAKVIGVISIPTTGWFSGGTGSSGIAGQVALPYAINFSTTLYACAVTRGTPTFASTSDVFFTFPLLRN